MSQKRKAVLAKKSPTGLEETKYILPMYCIWRPNAPIKLIAPIFQLTFHFGSLNFLPKRKTSSLILLRAQELQRWMPRIYRDTSLQLILTQLIAKMHEKDSALSIE